MDILIHYFVLPVIHQRLHLNGLLCMINV